jgi:hypothetical protein
MKPASRRLCHVLAGWLALGVCWAQAPEVTGESAATFGVTVVAPFGFCGRIYELPREPLARPGFPGPFGGQPQPSLGRVPVPGLEQLESGISCDTKLPKFERLEPIGDIYTTRLNVPPRDFREGFPGVTDRFEWFAIDYTARFWIDAPGKYSFSLLSDDGSAMYIDERRIIDNDCMHPPLTVNGSVRLEGGIHEMRVSYFQGPRFHVALQLQVKPPGGKWRVFDTRDFKPPANPADWKYSNSSNLDAPVDPCKAERRSRGLVTRP